VTGAIKTSRECGSVNQSFFLAFFLQQLLWWPPQLLLLLFVVDGSLLLGTCFRLMHNPHLSAKTRLWGYGFGDAAAIAAVSATVVIASHAYSCQRYCSHCR